jgi:hypothetical protein
LYHVIISSDNNNGVVQHGIMILWNKIIEKNINSPVLRIQTIFDRIRIRPLKKCGSNWKVNIDGFEFIHIPVIFTPKRLIKNQFCSLGSLSGSNKFPDPYPTKSCGSHRIRFRNTDKYFILHLLFLWVHDNFIVL